MTRQQISNHASTHLPEGSDPLPSSSGGGIQFNSGTYGADNTGDYLYVETNVSATPGPNGYGQEFIDSSGNGIHILTSNEEDGNLNGLLIEDVTGVGIQIFARSPDFSNGIDAQVKPNASGGGSATIGTTPTGVGSAAWFAQVGAQAGNTTQKTAWANVASVGQGNGHGVGVVISTQESTDGVGDVGVFLNGVKGTASAASLVVYQRGANTTPVGELFRVKSDGTVVMAMLPTSAGGLPSGALWNNGGVVNIV